MAPYAFPLLGEPVAVDLVNTIVAGKGLRVDLLAGEDQARAWWEAHERDLPGLGPADGPVLEPLRALRAAAAALFGAALGATAPPHDAVGTLNAASARAASFARLEWNAGDEPTLAVRSAADADAVARGLATIAGSAMAIVGGEDRTRLTVCDGPNCDLLFVATNPRRRWCSPTRCGNRVRAARHYRRRRAA